MPELPEVETIKLFLVRNLVGLKIKSVEILNPKSFFGDKNQIIGEEIKGVLRKGKVLQINFGQLNLLIHLKMSGQLILLKSADKEKFIGGHPTKDMFRDLPNKSTRVIFSFSDNTKLFFNDQRKFGWVRLVDANELKKVKFLNTLGPEPLDKLFTVELFRANLAKRKNTPVKVVLLDQQLIAGIGNIYACEACFLAGVDPRKKVSQLSPTDYRKIFVSIIKALRNGIKYGGSSRTHFISPEGKKGLFLNYAFVYGREGLPCKKCGEKIQKIKLGGRGTYFCPVCQVA